MCRCAVHLSRTRKIVYSAWIVDLSVDFSRVPWIVCSSNFHKGLKGTLFFLLTVAKGGNRGWMESQFFTGTLLIPVHTLLHTQGKFKLHRPSIDIPFHTDEKSSVLVVETIEQTFIRFINLEYTADVMMQLPWFTVETQFD